MGSIKSSPTADKCLVVFVADSIFPYQDQDSCTSEQGQSTLLLAGKDIHYLNNEFVSVGYNGILAYCGSGLGMQRGEEQMLSALLRNRDEQLCLKQKEQLQGIITSKYSEQILINSGVKHVEYGFCEDGVITDPMVMAARIHQQLGACVDHKFYPNSDACILTSEMCIRVQVSLTQEVAMGEHKNMLSDSRGKWHNQSSFFLFSGMSNSQRITLSHMKMHAFLIL